MPASVALPDSGTVTVRITVACPKCDSDTFTVGKSDSLACALCLAEFESDPVSPAFAQRFTLAEPDSDSDAYAAAFPHAERPAGRDEAAS